MDSSFDNIELFDQYVEGNLQGAAKLSFDKRLLADSEFSKDFALYQDMRQALDYGNQQGQVKADLAEVTKRLEAEQFYEQLSQKTQEGTRQTIEMKQRSYWWIAAASFLLIATLLGFANKQYSNQSLADLRAEQLLVHSNEVFTRGINTPSTTTMLLEGQQALAKKEYNSAINSFEKILSEHSQYPLARFCIAFAQYQEGQYDLALANTKQVLEHTPLDEELKEDAEWLRLQILLIKGQTKTSEFQQLLNSVIANKDHNYNQSAKVLLEHLNSFWYQLVW